MDVVENALKANFFVLTAPSALSSALAVNTCSPVMNLARG